MQDYHPVMICEDDSDDCSECDFPCSQDEDLNAELDIDPEGCECDAKSDK